MSRKISGACFVILLVCIGLLMFVLNAHTPLMMDDYDYSFSWSTGERIGGIGDIFASQAAHYQMWGGRSVTHFLAQLFLYWGKPVFNLANTAMYLLLLMEIYALGKRKEACWDWRLILAAHLLLVVSVGFFGVVFLWLDGACNYLWGTALALVPLLIARSERESGFFDRGGLRGWLALPLCFLAGWTNENTACGVLAALMLLLVWDAFQRRKIRLWRVASLGAQALGVAVMLIAPGNFARAAGQASRGFVMEMVYRIAVTAYCSLKYAGIPMVVGLNLLAAARRKKAPLRVEWLCVLIGAGALSAGALIGSPQISDRSFTAVIVLLIAALLAVAADIKPHADRSSLRFGAALAAAAVLCAVPAVIAVSRHGEAWSAREAVIVQAAESGLEEVHISSMPADPRYALSVILQQDADAWPNSTMSKYFGIRIVGD